MNMEEIRNANKWYSKLRKRHLVYFNLEGWNPSSLIVLPKSNTIKGRQICLSQGSCSEFANIARIKLLCDNIAVEGALLLLRINDKHPSLRVETISFFCSF